MAQTYDVVIVGAGPAGLMAARTLGQAGLQVALLERKKDIPKIHRSCGGVLNVNELTFNQMVTFDEDRQEIACTTLGYSIHYDGPHQDVYGFHLYSPGGKRLEFGDFAELRKDPKKNRLGVAVSKELLLRGLLEASEKSGVAVFPNTNVCGVTKTETGAAVACDDGQSFEGRFVLAADGINSRVARVMGMNKSREFFGTTCDTSVMIEGTDCPDPDGFLFMFTPQYVLSMIPVAQKNCYHIYATTGNRQDRPPAMLKQFMFEDPTFSLWYKRSRILEHRTACVVSLWTPIEKPFQDNVIFIGDASWRREMSNVGSMCTGFKAARCIIQALNVGKPNEDGMKAYLDWYAENYFGPFGARKPRGRNFNQYLTPDDMDYLVQLPDTRLPQTMDIFKVVNLIGSTYAALMERIYDERPDTLARLMQVRENMDEDAEKQTRQGFKNI
jgi:digeranylgeranylglycerophospholipid reductase